jgi:nucleotide sugar dehydrogenase
MTMVRRPSGPPAGPRSESIGDRPIACRHGAARIVRSWVGEPGTVGTVAVVAAGRAGRPPAVRYAGHGWSVVRVDLEPAAVDEIEAGQSQIGEEHRPADRVGDAAPAGFLRTTTDAAAATRDADVVVVIVPVLLDDEQHPDYRHLDAAVAAIGPGVHAGSTVILELAAPVGDTRNRFVPRLEAASGLRAETDFFVAISPDGQYGEAALRPPAAHPRLIGGVGPMSGGRAAAFYDSVLEEDVMLTSSSEAAELSRLAETAYRDVNIALANELARYADRVGIDVQEVVAAANTRPDSHIHQPGLGVGGPSIPVYPHFLLSRAPEMDLVELSRRVNDGQVGLAIRAIQKALGGLEDVPVLVLGLTYREGVRDLAYSRALPLIERLGFHGARVSAYDPLLSADDVERCWAAAYRWGDGGPFRAIVTQTADPLFLTLDFALFPDLVVVFDGRNSLRDLALPPMVSYRGVGVQAAARPSAEAAGT